MVSRVKSIPALSKKLKHKYGFFSSVLDIGCGIRPFSWVSSERITCVEPFEPYRKILMSSFGSESLVALKGDFLGVTNVVDVDQFDAVTLIDVIEHLPKEDGVRGLKTLIEQGVERLFVFTPDGFMPQHAEEVDAWGLNSGSQQEHLSGWVVEDFSALGFSEFWIVESLHVENGEVWDGLLAVYEKRREASSSKFVLWDPVASPNNPPLNPGRVIVFGRHHRKSGTVIGTHQSKLGRKYYLPSLSFLPQSVRRVYKSLLQFIIATVNVIL